MADETIGTRDAVVAEPLKFGRNPYRIYRVLHNGNNEYLAIEDNVNCKNYADWTIRAVERNMPANARVAFLGAGTCYMPRLFNFRTWGTVDIYELYQEIITKVQAEFPDHNTRWSFTQGDWRATITGTYDAIIHDIPETVEDADRTLIEQHLAPGGIAVYL